MQVIEVNMYYFLFLLKTMYNWHRNLLVTP